MKRSAVTLLVLALVDCSRATSLPSSEQTRQSVSLPDGAPAFREDDFDAALVDSKAKHLPLVVHAWAPWSHRSRSLRAFVLSDPSLAAVAPRFVWVALDVDKSSSNRFAARFPLGMTPGVWVIEPEHETCVLAWSASFTPRELVSLLTYVADAIARSTEPTPADAALARADALAAEGNAKDAATAYRQALADSAPEWPYRARAVDALVSTLAAGKDFAACAETAKGRLPTLPPGTAVADVAIQGLACAIEQKDAAAAGQLAAIVEKLATNTSLPILADDRSGLFEAIVAYERDRKDKDSVLKTARAWADFLDVEAKNAPSPEARTVFDEHRLLAYEALDKVGKILPVLRESESAFPNDYVPPALLARAFFDLKQWDASTAASNDALRKVVGPRKLAILAQKAEAQRARGDHEGEKATLEEAAVVRLATRR